MITARSPEWSAEKAWLEQQIAAAQTAMESPYLTDAETNVFRGEIAICRRRIAEAEGKTIEHPVKAANYQ